MLLGRLARLHVSAISLVGFNTGSSCQTRTLEVAMPFFKKLFKATLDTVALPADLIADAVTLGGVSVGNNETYTGRRLRRVARSLGDAYDSLDDKE
jgi:hypothetical protein